jgi:hypothetical protein
MVTRKTPPTIVAKERNILKYLYLLKLELTAFATVPSGKYYPTMGYDVPSQNAYFWAPSPSTVNNPYYMRVQAGNIAPGIGSSTNKRQGMSLRCLFP